MRYFVSAFKKSLQGFKELAVRLAVVVCFKETLQFSLFACLSADIWQPANLEEAIDLARPHVVFVVDQVIENVLADVTFDECAKGINGRPCLLCEDFQRFSFRATR